MKSFDTDVQKYTKRVKLSLFERRDLRARLQTYMEYHPLPKTEQQGSITDAKEGREEIISESFHTIGLHSFGMRLASGFFAMVFIVGVPLLAERAVPGDVLYLVKTGINENIRATFANSPYEKISLETSLIERRIAEARLLASEGKLTEEIESEIAATVKGHAQAAQESIDALRVDDAEEAAIAEITFNSALEVQSAVLESGAGAVMPTSSANGIREAVRFVQGEAQTRKGTTSPSYPGLLARVEAETTRAYELFSAVEFSATEEERVDIERRLADIDRKIEAAQSLVFEDKDAAIEKMKSALSMTQKLIAFMTDIDVREHVQLEKLVPIELTDEERIASVENVLREIDMLQQTTKARLDTVADEQVVEKVTIGLESLAGLLATATTSLANGEIVTAEQVVVDAYALAIDLEMLTLRDALPVDPDTTVIGGDEDTGTSSPEHDEVPIDTDATTTPDRATTTSDASLTGTSTVTEEEGE